MALARRTRMVSIRLSNEEFERLRVRTEQAGARSLSDIAREAMFLLLESETLPKPVNNGHAKHGHPEGNTLHRVECLEGQVESLQHAIYRLNGIVENICKSS